MPNIAVILSGCGHMDGAEIRESVLTLLYLDEEDAHVTIFAPDIEQTSVVNHLTQEATPEKRNVLVEAARIARGKIENLSTLDPVKFDALIIPGGFGVAKNLSDFASKGGDARLNPHFLQAIRGFYLQQKPIGAICIAPAVLAVALKDSGATLTIGEDAATAGVIVSSGCQHHIADSDQAVMDVKHRIVSCSAYMRDDRISRIAEGIRSVVSHVIDLVKSSK